MPNWMSPNEAMRYFGVDLAELEAIVVNYEIDVEVDSDGVLVWIDADDCKQPLFEEHTLKVGHRPDDWREMLKAKDKVMKEEEKAKQERETQRQDLVHRVSMGDT